MAGTRTALEVGSLLRDTDTADSYKLRIIVPFVSSRGRCCRCDVQKTELMLLISAKDATQHHGSDSNNNTAYHGELSSSSQICHCGGAGDIAI